MTSAREQKLLPQRDLDVFKSVLAEIMGIDDHIDRGYWGEVTSRDCGKVGGKIGGNMVKIMIREMEKQIIEGKQF